MDIVYVLIISSLKFYKLNNIQVLIEKYQIDHCKQLNGRLQRLTLAFHSGTIS